MERASTWAWDCQPPSEGAIPRTLKISGGQEDMLKQEFDASVRCILMLAFLKIISVVD